MPGSPAMKLTNAGTYGGGLVICGAAALYFLATTAGAITFTSRESTTATGGPVTNSIALIEEKGQEIWMMNQSHHGAMASSEKWDRLAIVVKKENGVKRARFYQLEPGPLSWNPKAREVPRRAACYTCHANGPRGIRPQSALAWHEWPKLVAWNLKIKTYGKIALEDPPATPGQTPVKFSGPMANERLKVAACTKCHGGSGPFARNALLRQQETAIHFMLKEGIMPPMGFKISPQERQEIEEFLAGF
ncbi:MAG: cytochrome c [Proteobacteria bacterium]|nr:MAG: cytochrome c [Pseudomonadota bacterium]